MLVTGSHIGMAAMHRASATTQVDERFYWRALERTDAAPDSAAPAPSSAAPQTPTPIPRSPTPTEADTGVAEETLEAMIDLSRAGSVLARHRLSQPLDFSLEADPKAARDLQILQATLKGIMGREFAFGRVVGGRDAAPVDFSTPTPAFAQSTPARELVYERQSITQERESLAFAARGRIDTADGRSIEFDISLTMSREFTQVAASQTSIFSSAPASLIDPIVINFDGKGAELLAQHVHFDLDMDGELDQIAQLGSGSGYLVWDKNADGQVNDGSELFGPQTGKGFAELAAADADGNGFIDAGDPIFSQLRLWVQRDDGTSQLLALGDKDVGAIYVGHVTTPFSFTDSQGKTLGQAANTGIYVKESGAVGLVQEVLLAKA